MIQFGIGYISSVTKKILVTFYTKPMTVSCSMSICSANSHNFHINTFITIFDNIGNINTKHYTTVIYIFTISVF